MRTNPKINKQLKRQDLTAQSRHALQMADVWDKVGRSYQPILPRDMSEWVARVHAQLLVAGLEQVCGQDIDLWLLRSLRDLPVDHVVTWVEGLRNR